LDSPVLIEKFSEMCLFRLLKEAVLAKMSFPLALVGAVGSTRVCGSDSEVQSPLNLGLLSRTNEIWL